MECSTTNSGYVSHFLLSKGAITNGDKIKNIGSLESNRNDIVGPIERCKWLRQAYDAYCHNKSLESIYYESIAMCLTFNLDYLQNISDSFPVWVNGAGKPVRTTNEQPSNCLLDYIAGQLALDTSELESGFDKIDLNGNAASKSKKPIMDDIDGCVENIAAHCAALPKEWTVLQICKMNTDYNGFANFKQYFTEKKPIKFSALCYARSELLQDRPLCFHLNTNENTLLDVVYNVYYVLYDTDISSVMFTQKMHDISTGLSTIIEMLKLWIGPWIVFFSGKIRGDIGLEFEKRIYRQVDEFAVKHNFSVFQKVYLSQFARRMDLVSVDSIENVAKFISKNQITREAIKQFLSKMKLTHNFKEMQYYPSILVLDELLDTIPWEMILPDQETSRFNSIYTLFDLFNEYEGQITDGYLRVAIKTGNILINPSNDPKLDNMVKRMSKFFSYWSPEWKQTINTIPTDFSTLLNSADIYIYSGHGSSFQFVNYRDQSELKTRSVMMLFGCSSTSMSFQGRSSEATATHMYMQASKCPALLGTLNIVTDLWVDVVSVLICSRWISSKKKTPWKPTCGLFKQNIEKLVSNVKGGSQPSLLANLSLIRKEELIGIRIRSSMICRGLPVFNSLTMSTN